MTWPEVSGLLKMMEEYPPIHALAAALVKQGKPKPMDEMAASAGLSFRKGKVKKHGDISR